MGKKKIIRLCPAIGTHIFFVKLLVHTLFYKHAKSNLITFFFLVEVTELLYYKFKKIMT